MRQRHWSIGKTNEREAAVAAASRRLGIDGTTELFDKLLEDTMSTQDKFVLETIYSAYGTGDTIPWEKAHREGFPTLAAARKALDEDASEMRKRCGPNAWDSHRRIVALQDTPIVAQFFCLGTVFREGHADGCAEYAEVPYVWPANTPQSTAVPDHPAGWYAAHQCSACKNLELKLEALYDDENHI